MKEYAERVEANEDILENEDEIIYKSEKLDFNYDYPSNNFIFKIFSNFIYYVIAFPILKILTKIIYDLKIEGKENLKNINSGIITVSNHVLVLDCAMVGIACASKKYILLLKRKVLKYLLLEN